MCHPAGRNPGLRVPWKTESRRDGPNPPAPQPMKHRLLLQRFRDHLLEGPIVLLLRETARLLLRVVDPVKDHSTRGRARSSWQGQSGATPSSCQQRALSPQGSLSVSYSSPVSLNRGQLLLVVLLRTETAVSTIRAGTFSRRSDRLVGHVSREQQASAVRVPS